MKKKPNPPKIIAGIKRNNSSKIIGAKIKEIKNIVPIISLPFFSPKITGRVLTPAILSPSISLISLKLTPNAKEISIKKIIFLGNSAN